MNDPAQRRRRLLAAAGGLAMAAQGFAAPRSARGVALYTFGDSVLDCGHYNEHGVHPGQLLVRNDDKLFPEFKGWDLQSQGPARLVHRAQDGATVDGLQHQLRGENVAGPGIALLSVGGNDLLRGLAADRGAGVTAFERTLARFIAALPLRPLFLATVYDPTFGDDSRNFLSVDARTARANHRRVNDVIGNAAARHGRLVDLHAHFLRGDPSWFTRTIEPSLIGASEVRRAYLQAIGVSPPR
ncbi:MAG TPA: SGNH/GDSL hydrolase family protein [Rubrivivax sp.]|nr:SGNH/GDSL hydrolase family protein [Rubrivivax sp.]